MDTPRRRAAAATAVVLPVPRRLPELEVLERLADAAGVYVDPTASELAWHQAGREVRAEAGEAGLERLRLAGRRLGLQIIRTRMSIRQAAGLALRDAPLVGYGPSGWVVITGSSGRRARLAGLTIDQGDAWVTLDDLARLRGAASIDDPLDWVSAQPAAPAGHAAADQGHGHEYDHGHAHHESMPPLRRIMRFLQPEQRDVLVVATFALGISLLSLATPIVVSTLVNQVAFGVMLQPVLVMSGILGFCLTLAAAMRLLQIFVVEYLSQRLFVRVAADFAHRLPRVRLDAYDHRFGPELVNRFFDIVTLQKTVGALLLDGVAIIMSAVIGMVVLAFYHPILLGLDILLIMGMAFVLVVLGRGGVQTKIDESIAKYGVAAWLEELARCPRAFKQTGGPDHAFERTDALVRVYLSARMRHFRIVLRQIAFALGLQVVASTVLLGVGGWLVIERQLTLGQLVAAELIVTLVVGSFAKLGKYVSYYYDLLAATDKLGHVFDLPLEPATGEGLTEGQGGAEVRLNEVGYDPDGHRPRLQPLSLHIKSGERVAVVGEPGTGKSVLAELLAGLRLPTSGRIELDGLDLREIRPEQLRELVVLVAGAEVFEGTVADNLRIGRPDLGVADLRKVLRREELLTDWTTFPAGLHTQLLPGGAPLSHTQALRLTLARAVLSRPRLLILDEVLDRIDLADCPGLLRMLLSPEAPWTLMVITSDPEVMQLFDRRITLHRPRIEPGLNGHA